MSIVERAAQRLEELRRAGIEVPVQVGSADSRKGLTDARDTHGQLQSTPSAGTFAQQYGAVTSGKGARTQGYFEINLARLETMGFITPAVPRSRIADEFRIIKRPLIANATDKKRVPIKHANLIMVTSSVAGEGKTFTAVNLAISLATELDRTVLLIDADVARPSLPGLLELPPSRGLLDALENKDTRLADVLLRTNIEKLSILPSGTPSVHATELLASEAMANLLEELSSRYSDRIVIFDSPPLLVTTESRVLAAQMGQVIFVVKAETTMQSDVKRALAAIESCPIKLMVLNQTSTNAQGAYGYGYGYGLGD